MLLEVPAQKKLQEEAEAVATNSFDVPPVSASAVSPFAQKKKEEEERLKEANLLAQARLAILVMCRLHVRRQPVSPRPFIGFSWFWEHVFYLLQSFLDIPAQKKFREEQEEAETNATIFLTLPIPASTVSPMTVPQKRKVQEEEERLKKATWLCLTRPRLGLQSWCLVDSM